MSVEFGKRLVQLRQQRNLSKSEFARLVGVSPTCVWNWEEGNTEPRSENLDRMAKCLGVSRSQILGEAAPASQQIEPFEVLVENRTNVSDPLVESTPLAEVIAAAKEQIAKSAGLPIHKVKIILDY